MADHYLISFLGLGNYAECQYRLAEAVAAPTIFPSLALARLLEPAPDTVLIAATEAARERYWERLNREWPADGPVVRAVAIPEAATKEDFWTIFSRLNDAVPDRAVVSLDVTHSFRHLPMLGFAVLDYMRQVRGVRVEGIHYGAYEVDNVSPPVFNLTEFLEVNAWADALTDVRRHGLTERLRGLIDAEVKPVLKRTRGRDANADAMRNLARALEEWSEACRFARGPVLEQFDVGNRILGSLDTVSEASIPALSPELKGIREFFADCVPSGLENLWHAARWCREHDLIQQGLTLLQEGVVTYWLETHPAVAGHFEAPQPCREYLSAVLNVANRTGVRDNPAKWKSPLSEHRELTRSILASVPEDLARAYAELTDARNDFNHGGYRPRSRPVKTLRKELKTGLERLKPYFQTPGRDAPDCGQ